MPISAKLDLREIARSQGKPEPVKTVLSEGGVSATLEEEKQFVTDQIYLGSGGVLDKSSIQDVSPYTAMSDLAGYLADSFSFESCIKPGPASAHEREMWERATRAGYLLAGLAGDCEIVWVDDVGLPPPDTSHNPGVQSPSLEHRLQPMPGVSVLLIGETQASDATEQKAFYVRVTNF